VNNTKNYSENNETNINMQKILNNQELYKSISSAYDKSIEVINKTSSEVNKVAEAIAKSNSKQVNVIDLKGAKITGSKLSVNQSNKLLKNVALSASLQFINEIDADNKTKAIVADMLGATQDTETIQKVLQAAAQTAEAAQESNQEAKQDFG
jgi:hypothetical protein